MARFAAMGAMELCPLEMLKNLVKAVGLTGAGGEYGHEQILRDQGRRQLRRLLLDGAASALTAPVDRVYFDGLRARARRHKAA